MKHPIIEATWKHGQSIWLDYISRRLIESGDLDRLVADGLRGLTSNPTIFQQAIAGSADYDREVQLGVEHEWDAQRIFEQLAVADISSAADALRAVWDESNGTDGFVSLEVSPRLAHETEDTIREAQHLWKAVSRPNLMIKVPATKEGIPAIRALLAEGLNINVTLIFSLEQYRSVLESFVDAIEYRVGRGFDASRVASVASFFVSRVDNVADKQLAERGRADLGAKTAIANACLAYRHFLNVTLSERWQKLAAAGAQVQRPLWASTSTKNPAYPDTLYVQELVAKDTVNTVPPGTLDAWKDHGRPEASLLRNLATAEQTLSDLAAAGIDVQRITTDLIEDGVKKFSDSYDQLLDAIRAKAKGGIKLSSVR
ncbi:transaldolase [candidate division KSB1 bacterium]|nr:transaldolase [candidate division KSB1 bacterium]